MKRTVKRTERQEHWLSHLEQAQALKVSLAQYCRGRGLNVQRLYNARHKLLGKAGRVGESSPGRKQVDEAGQFVAVELPALPAVTAQSGCRIQLGEVVIECAHLPSTQWLWALARGAGHAVP